ncbi:hypothetical protein B0T11DRAFT_275119 [Plectosphaerella cucumerina]|jgi:hypothetical protein|uniref:Uncharacterized protein n=1 Tax=Plectosphaerella cucumerina TaxID=40658 RepID=A0A8K0TJ32_9PEZI|nr:hypothetical protein B0T11DRAFT_275119 [Plectosphaerella cucumerina]
MLCWQQTVVATSGIPWLRICCRRLRRRQLQDTSVVPNATSTVCCEGENWNCTVEYLHGFGAELAAQMRPTQHNGQPQDAAWLPAVRIHAADRACTPRVPSKTGGMHQDIARSPSLEAKGNTTTCLVIDRPWWQQHPLLRDRCHAGLTLWWSRPNGGRYWLTGHSGLDAGVGNGSSFTRLTDQSFENSSPWAARGRLDSKTARGWGCRVTAGRPNSASAIDNTI